MISKQALEEFKAIYRNKFNEDISDEKALAEAINLLRLMDIVYRPITKKELEKVIKRRKEIGLNDDK